MGLSRFDTPDVLETDAFDSRYPILQHGNNSRIFLFVQLLQQHQARKEHDHESCWIAGFCQAQQMAAGVV